MGGVAGGEGLWLWLYLYLPTPAPPPRYLLPEAAQWALGVGGLR